MVMLQRQNESGETRTQDRGLIKAAHQSSGLAWSLGLLVKGGSTGSVRTATWRDGLQGKPERGWQKCSSVPFF